MTLALFLQYHQADYEQAMTLARFIAEIEPARREDIRFRFVTRFDARNPDPETFAQVGKKFDVSWGRTSRYPWSGWPSGPNGMAKEILLGAPKMLHEAGWDEVGGVLLLEPDCVPLSRSWLTNLATEWAVARDLGGKAIMGSWRGSGPACGHINGNCIFRPDIAKAAGAEAIGPHMAWDCDIAPRLKNKWHVTGLIRNDFQSLNATEEKLRTPETGAVAPVMVHGFKDDSAMNIARKWILT